MNNGSLKKTQNSWWCHSGAMWQLRLWLLPAKLAGTSSSWEDAAVNISQLMQLFLSRNCTRQHVCIFLIHVAGRISALHIMSVNALPLHGCCVVCCYCSGQSAHCLYLHQRLHCRSHAGHHRCPGPMGLTIEKCAFSLNWYWLIKQNAHIDNRVFVMIFDESLSKTQ